MKYGSVCSGIEAATVAWHPLGWKPEFFAEWEPPRKGVPSTQFPAKVLAHHYPEVPNLGDITKFKTWSTEPIELLVGGTPCQSFSVAGLRKGMADPRGNLALVFLAIADALRPRWILWENVPGVLSSNEGRDFGAFLGGMEELGYGWAYRVLDAQYFGLAQRRERVFVVGHLGDWRRAAAVLFERESLSWNPPPSRAAGQRAAACLTRGADSSGKGGYAGRRREDDENLIPNVAGTLNPGAHPGAYNGQDAYSDLLIAHSLRAQSQLSHRDDQDTLIAHALRGEGHDASEDGTGRGIPLVAKPLGAKGGSGRHDLDNETYVAFDCKAGGDTSFSVGEKPGALRGEGHGGGHAAVCFDSTQVTSKANRSNPKPGDPCHPLAAGAHPPTVAGTLKSNSGGGGHGSDPSETFIPTRMSVRRLTPRECERLQGFPDDYTLIPVGKKRKPAADGPRYKAIGNSMATYVIEWLGKRIELVDTLARVS